MQSLWDFFPAKVKFGEHIQTHTGDKPYFYDTCGFAFAVKLALVQHLRTHTGDKPNTYKECESCFYRRYI